MKLLHQSLGTFVLVAVLNAIAPLPVFAQQVTPSQTSGSIVADDFLTLATTATNDGDYHNAVYHANKALELDASLAEAYLLRGRAFSELGERDAAIADLEKAADLFLVQNDRLRYQVTLDILSGV